jgi:hypothetical protein
VRETDHSPLPSPEALYTWNLPPFPLQNGLTHSSKKNVKRSTSIHGVTALLEVELLGSVGALTKIPAITRLNPVIAC